MPGSLLSTLTHHSDYVTSLACSPNSNFVATAGLRGELFLVDMEVGGVAGLVEELLSNAWRWVGRVAMAGLLGELFLVDMEVGGVAGLVEELLSYTLRWVCWM